jgi:hypothetical protein
MLPCSARARGDDRPDSDIDIMIEIAPDAVQDVYAYVGNYIAGLFTEAVDVVDREALRSYVRPGGDGRRGLCLLSRLIRRSGCSICATTSILPRSRRPFIDGLDCGAFCYNQPMR